MFKAVSPIVMISQGQAPRLADQEEHQSVLQKVAGLAKKHGALSLLVTSLATFSPDSAQAVDITSMTPEESAAYFRSLAERAMGGAELTDSEQKIADMTNMIREGRILDYLGEIDINAPTERPSSALAQQNEFQPFDLDNLEMVSLNIQDSFSSTVAQYELDDRLVAAIKHVAEWHVSMNDLTTGDQVDFLYDASRLETDPLVSIHTLSITHDQGNQHFAAIAHEDHKGEGSYFTPYGEPLRVDVVNPIAVDGDYRISSPYGPRVHPVTGRHSYHAGIDIAYGHNEPRNGKLVQSAADGVVAGKGFDRNGGNYIMIDHPGGLRTVYMHLHRFAPDLKVGDTVSKGETLGGMGNTGRSTGAHLHLEFRVNVGGEWRHTDPLSFSANDHAMTPESVAGFIQSRNFSLAQIDPNFDTSTPISQVALHIDDRSQQQVVDYNVNEAGQEKTLETSSVDIGRQCEQIRNLFSGSSCSWESKAIECDLADKCDLRGSAKGPSLG